MVCCEVPKAYTYTRHETISIGESKVRLYNITLVLFLRNSKRCLIVRFVTRSTNLIRCYYRDPQVASDPLSETESHTAYRYDRAKNMDHNLSGHSSDLMVPKTFVRSLGGQRNVEYTSTDQHSHMSALSTDMPTLSAPLRAYQGHIRCQSRCGGTPSTAKGPRLLSLGALPTAWTLGSFISLQTFPLCDTIH